MTPGVFECTMGSCNVCVPCIQGGCGCVCVGVVGGAILYVCASIDMLGVQENCCD